jgi:hypothetical protein
MDPHPYQYWELDTAGGGVRRGRLPGSATLRSSPCFPWPTLLLKDKIIMVGGLNWHYHDVDWDAGGLYRSKAACQAADVGQLRELNKRSHSDPVIFTSL